MKKIILTILVILWMILIFGFSSQTGNESTKTSDTIVNRAVYITEKVGKKDYTKNEKKSIRKIIERIIRKLAHFTEYFILAILVYLMFKEYGVSNLFMWTMIFCILYSMTDEFHQLFISERTGKIYDIFIDTFGSFVAMLIIKLKRKKISQ